MCSGFLAEHHVEPYSAEVTAETKDRTQNQGGDQVLPVTACGKGAEATHKGAGAEVKELEVGNDAHDEGDHAAPYAPGTACREQTAEEEDRHTTGHTCKIGAQGLTQTGETVGTAGEIGGTACKAGPAEQVELGSDHFPTTAECYPNTAKDRCGNAEPYERRTDFLHNNTSDKI